METDQNTNLDNFLTHIENFIQSTSISSNEGHARISKSKKRRIGKCGDTTCATVYLMDKTPSYIKNGELRDYQILGVNWLISLHARGINGILADEMGLGKTLQTITLFGYLKHVENITGHLIIVPLSTVKNWLNEFEKWCPTLRVISFVGNKEERKQIRKNLIIPMKWDVCVTSYELCVKGKYIFKPINWEYIVCDEAHRLKNENSLLGSVLREFKSTYRLLLTGTPLQNNLHEFWALLNYLFPNMFHNSDDFDSIFNVNKFLDNSSSLDHLHSIMKPIMLRRIKSEVEPNLPPKKEIKIYVGLTEMQHEWYTNILKNNVTCMNSFGHIKQTRLNNVLMQLRKCTNHPYLFKGAETEPYSDQKLLNSSGKLIVLDKLLHKLKTKGSRILLFSQMTKMLDILEDYCIMQNFEYCRLDGSLFHTDRIKQIEEFNKKCSKRFIFLLSTRAGGLGINLATADVVILYDSDWNPQVDLQAIDRAHRIGQTKPVRVFRLITEHTVDEKITERAEKKLQLDKIVVQNSLVVNNNLTKHELLEIIRFDAMHLQNVSKNWEVTDDDIDRILLTSEKNSDVLDDSKLEEVKDLAVVHKVSFVNQEEDFWLYKFEGENYHKKREDTQTFVPLKPRQSKVLALKNMNIETTKIDELYKEHLNTSINQNEITLAKDIKSENAGKIKLADIN